MTQNNEGGQVNLPAVPDEGAVDGVVIDKGKSDNNPQSTYVLQVINVVARHPHTRTAARQAGYVAAGPYVAWKRWRRRRSLAEELARHAHLSGDRQMALQLLQHSEAERKGRHERRVKTAETLIALVRASPWIFAVITGLMFLLGVLLAMARGSIAMVAWPFTTTAHVVSDLVSIASLLAVVLLAAVPAGLLAVLHHLGRTAGDLAPAWSTAAKDAAKDRGLIVTADGIVVALDNLTIAPLKKARKDGWKPVFTTPPVRDGRGYEAEFSLPMGVTPEMIADQRPVFARNLHREEIEVWPSAGAPGYAKVWVADRGAISKAAPEYPLLHDGEADVFEGVPGGVLARGDGALIPVVAANGVLGGLMGQGKSNAGRVVMLGCATDPLCGLDVFVFANNGDFDAYEPRLAVYRKGLDDDVIESAVERLHEAYRDVGEREQMLADLGAKKLTRQLAQQYPALRPHVSLFSECHELFGHPEYGEMAGELAVKIVKRQRKTGRVAWFDTQSSRKAAIPPALVELVSVNCCFAVKSWRSNDGFLGDGSFAAGIRATELRPGRDRGTSLVTGISDAQFELLKWYYVEVDDDTGYDAAADVIARTMRSVAPGTPVGASVQQLAIEMHDLLEDVAEVVTGDDRVRLADLPARLRRLAPAYLPYRQMNGVQLRQLLEDEGVRTLNPRNVPTLDQADLRAAIRRRDGEVS